MYNPAHFREERPEVLHEFMRTHPLAALVTLSANGLEANHIPLILDAGKGVLRGHVSRANTIWQTSQTEALAIFTGPEHYISPSWYPAKKEHGRVVPTWNYTAVHVRGTLTFFEEAARLRAIVEELTQIHEASLAQPWKVDDAPPEYVYGLLKAIVGFELKIVSLEGKWKASQNRSEADRASVVEALRNLGATGSAETIR
ncbi:MAG TPA: FMN-binding negative transcriptional regulator [Bryobacteraceae bacterium]|nr:FMN-binding negative transcriptional regulator [Bryobacteraceae bacterium]